MPYKNTADGIQKRHCAPDLNGQFPISNQRSHNNSALEQINISIGDGDVAGVVEGDCVGGAGEGEDDVLAAVA